MKLIWLSDIHLNFLNEISRSEFYQRIKEVSTSKDDVVVVSGDIAESHNVVPLICSLKEAVQNPVYFVLGNHDFYGSNIADVKRIVKPHGYLGDKQIVALTSSVALIGVDGWGDCRYGDYENSHLTMSDWIYIDDLRKHYGSRTYSGKDTLKAKLRQLADGDARKLKRRVDKAIKNGYNKIIIVTHVPPFEEAALHAGRKSTPSGLPFFASKCLGEAILPLAKAHKDVEFLWLSGHTHSRAVYKPCDNMTVKVAKAEYYYPQIEETINV